jgi:hypothetical protein
MTENGPPLPEALESHHDSSAGRIRFLADRRDEAITWT